MIVVADTSPPLHLGRIGRLDLLPTGWSAPATMSSTIAPVETSRR